MINEKKIKYITDNKGNKKEVVLPVEEFERLIEDLTDLAAIAERRDEKTVSHEEVLRELKKDGRI